MDTVTSAKRIFVSATVMPPQRVERTHLPRVLAAHSMFVARNGAFAAPATISAAQIQDVRVTTADLQRSHPAPLIMSSSE